MDNYQVTSWLGFGILSPPNWTSPFGFYSLGVSLGLRDGDLDTCFACHSKLEHCFDLGLKVNRSSFSLMWNLISPAPTSMCAFIVLRKGLPRIRGVFMSSCMSSTTKSTGIKKFCIFTRIFSVISVG